MNSKSHPTTEISAVQRRFLHLFAMNDTAGISGCYTQDAQMLVANMDVIRARAAMVPPSIVANTWWSGSALETSGKFIATCSVRVCPKPVPQRRFDDRCLGRTDGPPASCPRLLPRHPAVH